MRRRAAMRYVRNFGQNNSIGGGRRQAANAPKTLRQNINFNGSYSHAAGDSRNIFLPLGGTSESDWVWCDGGLHDWVRTVDEQRFAQLEPIARSARNYFTNGDAIHWTETGI